MTDWILRGISVAFAPVSTGGLENGAARDRPAIPVSISRGFCIGIPLLIQRSNAGV
jgi:hypothetical protein